MNAANGYVLAQSPENAAFDGMPQSVIRSGIVDDCLPARALPQRCLELCVGDPLGTVALDRPTSSDRTGTAQGSDADALQDILFSHSGIDFQGYKQKTLDRRVLRRLHSLGMDSLESYVEFLKDDPAEAATLVKELLIGVTSFFGMIMPSPCSKRMSYRTSWSPLDEMRRRASGSRAALPGKKPIRSPCCSLRLSKGWDAYLRFGCSPPMSIRRHLIGHLPVSTLQPL